MIGTEQLAVEAARVHVGTYHQEQEAAWRRDTLSPEVAIPPDRLAKPCRGPLASHHMRHTQTG